MDNIPHVVSPRIPPMDNAQQWLALIYLLIASPLMAASLVRLIQKRRCYPIPGRGFLLLFALGAALCVGNTFQLLVVLFYPYATAPCNLTLLSITVFDVGIGCITVARGWIFVFNIEIMHYHEEATKHATVSARLISADARLPGHWFLMHRHLTSKGVVFGVIIGVMAVAITSTVLLFDADNVRTEVALRDAGELAPGDHVPSSSSSLLVGPRCLPLATQGHVYVAMMVFVLVPACVWLGWRIRKFSRRTITQISTTDASLMKRELLEMAIVTLVALIVGMIALPREWMRIFIATVYIHLWYICVVKPLVLVHRNDHVSTVVTPSSASNDPVNFDHLYDLMYVIRDPRGYQALHAFVTGEYSTENTLFHAAIIDYVAMRTEDAVAVRAACTNIYKTFIDESALFPINIPGHMRNRTASDMQQLDTNALLNVFEPAHKEILLLIKRDSFPRFLCSSHFEKFKALHVAALV